MTAIDAWIETPRGRLFARRSGPPRDRGRAPLVMFHDSLGCVDLWGSFPRSLAEATGREVIAYDRLGYGRSDPRRDAPKPDFFREEIEEFFPHVRRALGLSRFALFGHSVGGGMAITLAALEAEACVAVISESAQAVVEARTITGIADARRALEVPEVRARLVAVHGDKTDWIIESWSNAWLELMKTGWTLTATLPQPEVPLLILHGDQDEFGTLANPTALGDWAGAKAKIEIFPDTKHIPHRQNKERVLDLTSDFLSDKD